ncbi:hypothetical protein CC86DRAFT_281356 [Ophiobolus disseminans]|uniref:DUF7053 domain-containing protein n=1 Tax=Ophiobolus disseminans TaxID=1469910 RepID=A0A6A7AIC4_9PLEO|nr:hypothetical protein CC86DRAFT_281356 [Ophiobolus disseminans]
MTSKHHLHTASAIPARIDPSIILAALHDHNTTLTLQALTQGHEKLASTDTETLKDTYWYPTDLNPVVTYKVTEVITFLPGVGDWGKKSISFPVCYQETPTGIRTRADTSGLVLRAEYRIVKGGAAAEVEGEGEGVGDAEWVLVEDVEVSCAWWMMPFVKGKMEEAHRGICGKVVEKIIMEQRQRAVAGVEFGGRHSVESPHTLKGKERLNTDKHLPSVPLQKGVRGIEGAVEVDALETQRNELPADDLPEKITYR